MTYRSRGEWKRPEPIGRSQVSDNRVLASMSEADFAVLGRHMSIVDVPQGKVLIGQGEPVTEVHFPLTADLSNRVLFSTGQAVETSAVGRLGVSGLAAFLAHAPCAWEVRVQTPGRLVRLPAAPFRDQAWVSAELMRLLLAVTHDNQAEGAQTAACNVTHDAPSRLARWLLMIDDRTGADRLRLSQEDLAQMLGAQRTTVSVAAANLKRAGAISYTRSNIHITDRAALQRWACECYAAQQARASLR